VAGIKYILEVELGWTNCSKSQYRQHPDLCILDSSKPTFNCDFHVVEKSWENTKEVVHGKCHKDDLPATFSEDPVVAPTLNEEPDNTEVGVEGAGDSDTLRRRRKREAKYGEARESEEDKEKLMEIAKFAVEQLDQVDEDNLARLVVDILNANKQVG